MRGEPKRRALVHKPAQKLPGRGTRCLDRNCRSAQKQSTSPPIAAACGEFWEGEPPESEYPKKPEKDPDSHQNPVVPEKKVEPLSRERQCGEKEHDPYTERERSKASYQKGEPDEQTCQKTQKIAQVCGLGPPGALYQQSTQEQATQQSDGGAGHRLGTTKRAPDVPSDRAYELGEWCDIALERENFVGTVGDREERGSEL